MTPRIPAGRALAALAALACAAPPAAAESPFRSARPEAEARLLAGWAEPGGGRVAALLVELAPGWKTYWRAPGEAGAPPEFDWTGSTNLAGVEIVWPAPEVFESYGMRTIGYRGRMLLPLRLEAEDPARPIDLRLRLFYGVCDEVCLPEEAELALAIPPGAPAEAAAEIGAALAAEPLPAAAAGVVAAHCRAGAEAMTARLDYASPPAEAPVVVAEGPEGVSFGPFDARLEAGGVAAEGPIRLGPGAWLDRSQIRLTLLDGEGRGWFVEGCPAG